MKLVSAAAILTAFASTLGLAQQSDTPKVSKADVQKVLDSIMADKAKMAAYCESAKLDDEASAIAAKNPKDPKLQSIASQIDEANKEVGPDFVKIMNSELDDASGTLLDDLTKSCKYKSTPVVSETGESNHWTSAAMIPEWDRSHFCRRHELTLLQRAGLHRSADRALKPSKLTWR